MREERAALTTALDPAADDWHAIQGARRLSGGQWVRYQDIARGPSTEGKIMTRLHVPSFLALMSLLLLGACAARPVNPPITQTDLRTGYRFETRQAVSQASKENLVILAFSGGGTRAAAFSYGVLEFLRRTEIVTPNGAKFRLIDSIDVITGVSGGSFTALAYGLYGDKLFDDYEQRFLKRNVQGEIIARILSPAYWGKLGSTGWGRSELAAQLYDEILFNGATFGDLDRGT